MPHKVFEQINKDREEAGDPPFANPRNSSAGTLKIAGLCGSGKTETDCIMYVVYTKELHFKSHYESLKESKNWGFKVSEFIAKCRSMAEVFEFIDYWTITGKSWHSILTE